MHFQVVLNLPDVTDLAQIVALEGNITYDHGGTNTHLALDLMKQQFTSNVNNPKVAILLTDGSSFEQAKTFQSAYNAKRDGVVMFVIGIGDDVNKNEASQISSSPDAKYLFQVSDFGALQSVADQFHKRNCTGN